MQLTNTFSSFNTYSLINYEANEQIENNHEKNISDLENTSAEDSTSLLPMTLEEIQKYLQDNGIEDETGNRAKDLLLIQNFIGKVDDGTYTRMFDALNKEKTTSQASMRYSTFPSQEMLEENPRMFHTILNTTLDMEDTTHALIFTLDLKAVLSNQAGENSPSKLSNTDKPPTLEMDIDFDMMTLIGFLQKKMEEIAESARDGLDLSEQNFLSDYAALLGNYEDFDGSSVSPKVNITV